MNKEKLVKIVDIAKNLCIEADIDIKVVENLDFEAGSMVLAEVDYLDLEDQEVEPGVPMIYKDVVLGGIVGAELVKVNLIYLDPSEKLVFSISLPDGDKELEVLESIQEILLGNKEFPQL